MSFLVDPPLLFGSGVAIERAVEDERTAKRLGAATVVFFLVISISLYLNARWTHWLARLCRAENGRDWMLNSGVFRFDHRSAGGRTHLAAAAIFVTYPAWIWLGLRTGSAMSRDKS
jgi:hypothetical protein